MGTGIVSIALSLDGRHAPSDVLLAICAAIWIALAVLGPASAVIDAGRVARGLGDPAALAAVAASGVLGTRLTMFGWTWAGATLLSVAFAAWLVLVPVVLWRWRMPTTGTSFLLAVAAESLALLAAELAGADHTRWLLYAALVPFCLGLGCYVFVVSGFQSRQLRDAAGDHWVAGGALAISAATAGQVVLSAQRLDVLSGALAGLHTLVLVLWCLTMAWLPVLLAAEVLHPRIGYASARWSTVFPVGMYAVCSFTAGAVARISEITEFARIWVWLAAGLWLVVFTGMLRRVVVAVRSARVDSG